MAKNTANSNNFGNIIAFICGTITAMVGYNIHNSIGWTILDFLFWPIAWAKWLILHEVNISIIKETFAFFFK